MFKDNDSNNSANSSQAHATAPVASCSSILDYRLLKPLLRHPSISQDQQAIAALLQTSKQLQAAVAELLPGKLPVVLHARKPQQAAAFASWLQKHGSLLQALTVQWVGGDRYCLSNATWRPAAEAAFIVAVQEAAAAGHLQLQSFTVQGSTARSILQHLPAAHLTQLTAAAGFYDSNSMDAVRALTNLRSLTLRSVLPTARRGVRRGAPAGAQVTVHRAVTRAASALVALPFWTGLQQVTRLDISQVRPALLHAMAGQLPPQLQQLHVGLDAGGDARELELLASWLQQHGHIVSSMTVGGTRCAGPGWAAAWTAVAAAFQAAEAAAPPPAADDAAPGGKRWQLQSLSVDMGADETAAALQQLLQHLPAHSLTQLGCCVSWAGAGQLHAPPVNELRRLTGLCSLHLNIGHDTTQQTDQLLAPLSALPQLTELQLQGRPAGRG
uniref:F-box domain-containing protein n=1 Tax=Tetradesmus obliquus TaxID=3088 RepID=A0A383WI33_TETOB|eukprot:jgi/Sobl393_1/17320/SZX71968.1